MMMDHHYPASSAANPRASVVSRYLPTMQGSLYKPIMTVQLVNRTYHYGYQSGHPSPPSVNDRASISKFAL